MLQAKGRNAVLLYLFLQPCFWSSQKVGWRFMHGHGLEHEQVIGVAEQKFQFSCKPLHHSKLSYTHLLC